MRIGHACVDARRAVFAEEPQAKNVREQKKIEFFT
jgi:hypothetical protein